MSQLAVEGLSTDAKQLGGLFTIAPRFQKGLVNRLLLSYCSGLSGSLSK
jgi:hypothetical protein